MTIDEVYVTGAEWDTNLMIKRSDTLSAAAGAGFAGRTVTVAAFFRVKNRRITEWLDAPVVNPAANARPRPADAPVTIKPPSSYNQQEREAVEVVRGWLNAWTAYDLNKLMSYMAEDSIYRGDPSESLGRRAGFQSMAQGVMNGWCGMDLEEIFVIGGERDTMVLSKRIDYFPGDSGFGALRGMAIPVAVMFRIRGGKIVEYLDAPLIPVGPGAWGAGGRRGGAPPVAPAGGPGGARGGPVGTCSAKIN
jgi:limonene-1,2-epoxide hydrolase